MTDRYDQDMILGYVEGELSDDQRAAFETTLADDHELRQLVSQMRLDREALRSLAGMSAPVGLVDQVMQAQERDALLGDPAAPEPLPMVVPVSRRKVRRLLAYSAVAAVLLLSFGVVLMTLTPPDLLNKSSSGLAQNKSPGAPLVDTGSSLAMADEDAVYDDLGERALGRQLSDRIKAEETPTVLAMKEGLAGGAGETGGTGGTGGAELFLEAESAPSLALSSDGLKRGDAVVPLAGKPPVRVGGFAGLTKSTNTLGARAREVSGPYAGYARLSSVLPAKLQLQIASTSPTQARRDIRDWAIANSARVVDEPAHNVGQPFAVARRNRASTSDVPVRGLVSTPDSTGFKYEEPAEQQLVLFVDDAQVPGLLAYLNRSESQRANVVPIIEEGKADNNEASHVTRFTRKKDTPDPASGATLAEALTETPDEQPAGADVSVPTVALSNRWVEIESVWRGESSLSSLKEVDRQPTAHPPAPSVFLDAVEPLGLTGSERSEAHESKNKRNDRTMRFEDFLNWGPPLPSDVPPPLATQPASQPQAVKQRRLQVIIRQVAESELRIEAQPAADTSELDDGE